MLSRRRGRSRQRRSPTLAGKLGCPWGLGGWATATAWQRGEILQSGRRRDGRAAAARGSGAARRCRRLVGAARWSKASLSVDVLQLVLIGLMLFGVVLVGVGVKLLVDTRRFLPTAESAEGVVVRVDKSVSTERCGDRAAARAPSPGDSYFPFVQSGTARGQVAQFQADDGSLRVGDSVRPPLRPGQPAERATGQLGQSLGRTARPLGCRTRDPWFWRRSLWLRPWGRVA